MTSGNARLIALAEQSAYDDLESLGYVFLYLLRKSLPWQGLQSTQSKDKYDQILEKKESLTSEELCDGLLDAFVLYFDHIRSICSPNQPDYSYLRRIFSKLFRHEGFKYDHVFDWTERMYFLTYGDRDQGSKNAAICSEKWAQRPQRMRGKKSKQGALEGGLREHNFR